ncbi:MAG: heme NO-binding domain-containing protein [Gammaproteobacteria bacterium]
MKGLVFTEFIEYVDNRFSFETSENLIEISDLPSEGVYTSVGTYEFRELETLVRNLSYLTDVPVAEILREFGRHLFRHFLISFPIFFEGIKSTLAFLPRVQDYIHLEVRKLYPDAELPDFICNVPAQGQLIMVYRSTRNLEDLAEGLIQASIDYFGDSLTVKRSTDDSGDEPVIRFFIAPK